MANYAALFDRLRCWKHTVTINVTKCRRCRGCKLIIKPVVALATYNFVLGFVMFFFIDEFEEYLDLLLTGRHLSVLVATSHVCRALWGNHLTHLRKMTNPVFAASQLIQQVCFHLPVFAY